MTGPGAGRHSGHRGCYRIGLPCHSQEPSPVLLAMPQGRDQALSVARDSVAADRPLYADTSSSTGRARSGVRCGKDG